MVLTSDTLRDTDTFLSSVSKKQSNKPSDINIIYFILATEFGLTLDKIQDLPIPYLLQLIDTYNYLKKEEEKAYKKANKKKK